MKPKNLAFVILTVLIAFAGYKIREHDKTAQLKVCLQNLKMIDSLVNHCIPLEQKLSIGLNIPRDEFTNYMKGGLPHCPAGADYVVAPVGGYPVCPIHGNLLETNVHLH